MTTAPTGPWREAASIAEAVSDGRARARDVVEESLARIAAQDDAYNAFTDVTAVRARAEASEIDAARDADAPLGPLAGVPYAVKNLFDVEGLPTRAGSKINRSRPPATRDAALVRRMRAAGAVLTGALNMGEFAYDFTGENVHDGPCRNPHDPTRMTGGSSSGTGAVVAAGLTPIALGSDTNGSLRVPASLCGVFSLKPTYGRLSRAGTYPFIDSLDHVGPLARTVRDLAVSYDALQGPDPEDHVCAQRPVEPTTPDLARGVDGMRVGVACGWFAAVAGVEARQASETAAEAFARSASVTPVLLEGAEIGRAAAALITNAEGGALHLDRLRTRADDFDPDTRDRFRAGALLPAAWIARAQAARRWWRERMRETFRQVDLILAPATPMTAPKIGEREIEIDGRRIPLRPNLGLFAQPFSCVGAPVVTAPRFEPGAAPIGLQLIAPPWREDLALRAAAFLAAEGLAIAHPPPSAK